MGSLGAKKECKGYQIIKIIFPYYYVSPLLDPSLSSVVCQIRHVWPEYLKICNCSKLFKAGHLALNSNNNSEGTHRKK